MRRLKTDKTLIDLADFSIKIDSFIVHNVNFVEKHAKIIKVLSVF